VQKIAAKRQRYPSQVSTCIRQAIEGIAHAFLDKVKKAGDKDGKIKELQGSPEPLDKVFVHIATSPTHSDFDIDLRQCRNPICTLILTALIRIQDLELVIFGDG